MSSLAYHELAPGAVRAWEAAHELATSNHAVPQHKILMLPLEDGWTCWLKKYEYQPLKQSGEIRVLRLHPWETRLRSDIGALPTCELIHATLDDKKSGYVALSYAWGDINQYSSVHLQEDQCLCVTNSLWHALNALSTLEPLNLWIDQLCINQYDLPERNEQVKLIARIFEQATMTLVWLGSKDSTTDAAYDLIHRLSQCGVSLLQSYELFNDHNVSSLIGSLQDHGIDTVDIGWYGIQQIAARPWFSRLWTFQEVVVSRDLVYQCGDRQCKHDDLLRAFYMLQLLHACDVVGKTHMALVRSYRSSYHVDRSCLLPQLLKDISTSEYKCQLPQDRVYALIALQRAGPANHINIEVSYGRSVGLVFAETAKQIINSTKELSILHRRRYGYLKDLPSWALDWSVTSLVEQIDDTGEKFSCARGMQHKPEQDAVNTLTLKGRIFARIVKVAAHQFSFYGEEYKEGDLDAFLGSEKLLPLILNALKQYSSTTCGTPEESAAHRAWLLATTLTGGYSSPQDQEKFLPNGSTTDPLDIVPIFVEEGVTCVRTLVKCLGRTVGMLDNDMSPVALLPDYARNGDLVCIVEGSSLPLVLRK